MDVLTNGLGQLMKMTSLAMVNCQPPIQVEDIGGVSLDIMKRRSPLRAFVYSKYLRYGDESNVPEQDDGLFERVAFDIFNITELKLHKLKNGDREITGISERDDIILGTVGHDGQITRFDSLELCQPKKEASETDRTIRALLCTKDDIEKYLDKHLDMHDVSGRQLSVFVDDGSMKDIMAANKKRRPKSGV